MDGNMQTCILTNQRSHFDNHLEFEILLGAAVDGDGSSNPTVLATPTPTTSALPCSPMDREIPPDFTCLSLYNGLD